MMRPLVLATFAALCAAPAAQGQAARYEGPWNVEISTQTGACGGPYKVLVTIDGGTLRLGGADPSAMQLGSVAASGAVTGQVRRGSLEVSIRGRLVNAAGTGEWSLAREGGACAGRWLAEKSAPRF